MTVLIDADGCPVVNITLKVVEHCVTNNLPVTCLIICDTSHVFQRDGATTVTVSKGADSADFALVNKVQKDDIVITQDYGLAAMCLAKGAVPLSQDGMIYCDDNIDALLLARHTSKKIRMSGGRHKGNSKRTKKQDIEFEEALRKLLCV